MFAREAELLEIAKAKIARLPQVERADVLIVDEIGKDISGDGADPNVINRDVAGVIDFTEAIPAPEPSSMVLLVGALAGLSLRRRIRKSTSASA